MKPEIKTIHDYLPKSLHHLMTVIGMESLLVLIKTQGGTRLSIPKKVNADHWLSGLIGLDDLKKLANFYGGGDIDMPRCVKMLSLLRDIEVLLDSRKRLTGKQLALKYGMTERGIQKVLRRIEPYERQAWLKDLQIILSGNS